MRRWARREKASESKPARKIGPTPRSRGDGLPEKRDSLFASGFADDSTNGSFEAPRVPLFSSTSSSRFAQSQPCAYAVHGARNAPAF